jgi:hypothetical protein
MRFTQHLTVIDVCCAAFAPSGDVVGIHISEFPDFAFVGIVS